MPSTPVVGYWNIRGLAESIRFLLHHVGVKFEDKRYEFAENIFESKWFEEKNTLGLEYPNIPYYIDDEVKITQSLAILRYLARKHGLFPTSPKDVIEAETLEQISKDIFQANIFAVFKVDSSIKIPNVSVPDLMKARTEDIIRQVQTVVESKEWLVAGKLSYVDFLMYEAIAHYSYRVTDFLVRFPGLAKYLKRFEDLPNIKKYIEGGSYKEWPIYGVVAPWGGSGEMPKREGVL